MFVVSTHFKENELEYESGGAVLLTLKLLSLCWIKDYWPHHLAIKLTLLYIVQVKTQSCALALQMKTYNSQNIALIFAYMMCHNCYQ